MKDAAIQKLLERKQRIDELYWKFKPHNKQQEVLDAIKEGYKKIFILAGRRSGKTESALSTARAVSGLKSNATATIICPSLKQGKRIYWKKRKLQNSIHPSWIQKEANDELTVYLDNGSYIEVDGCENTDAHRGDEKDIVILDEYKDIDENFYTEVVEPMLATTDGIVVVLGTPPKEADHHFWRLLLLS